MLIRFAVANHRSIGDPVELSLVAVDQDRPAVRHFDRLSEGVLPLAAIYGPNASGKSNIIDALSWLSSAVRNSLRLWENGIPREPFLFKDYSTKSSQFEIEFIIEGVRHQYSLRVGDAGVEFEELLSFPEKRARTLFSRTGDEIHFRRGLNGGLGIRELMSPITLVLSAARRFGVPELQGPARYLSDFSAPFARRRRARFGPAEYGWPSKNLPASTRRLFIDAYRTENSGEGDSPTTLPGFPLEFDEDVRAARALLRFADLGIDDIEVFEHKEGEEASRLDLRLVHRSGPERVHFSMHDESDGTQMWFRLLGPTLAALRSGQVLILDEIDASLHPLLSARLLELFRSAKSNPKNAQLIFTTHDTTLLGELNRDEVWFTEKGDDGATLLTALAEYSGSRVRRSVNLERAYLQGRFGALPRLRASTLPNVEDVERHGENATPDYADE